MRRYLYALGGLVLLLVSVSCYPNGGNAETYEWAIVQSPLTGRCYEVMYRDVGKQMGVLAMALIPCPAGVERKTGGE